MSVFRTQYGPDLSSVLTTTPKIPSPYHLISTGKITRSDETLGDYWDINTLTDPFKSVVVLIWDHDRVSLRWEGTKGSGNRCAFHDVTCQYMFHIRYTFPPCTFTHTHTDGYFLPDWEVRKNPGKVLYLGRIHVRDWEWLGRCIWIMTRVSVE